MNDQTWKEWSLGEGDLNLLKWGSPLLLKIALDILYRIYMQLFVTIPAWQQWKYTTKMQITAHGYFNYYGAVFSLFSGKITEIIMNNFVWSINRSRCLSCWIKLIFQFFPDMFYYPCRMSYVYLLLVFCAFIYKSIKCLDI